MPLCVGKQCGKVEMAVAIDTAAKRAKLKPRKNPYWYGVSGGRGGLSLGYRKSERRSGRWVAKIVVGGRRVEERVGAADDEPVAGNALSFAAAVAAALDWGRRQMAALEAANADAVPAKTPTVRSAIIEYIGERRKRAGRKGSEVTLEKYILRCGAPVAAIRLSRLTAQAIEEWRDQLPARLTGSAKNRILNDLRAALNAAALKYRRQLPTHLLAEIKIGTKAKSAVSNSRRQLLTDHQVRAVVNAAFEVDPDGDFGRLVLVSAATGSRFSQLAALRVADVQSRNERIMVPSSRKGKKRQPGLRTAVPVAVDVIDRLAPVLKDRAMDDPLLMRWGYRQSAGPLRWKKDKRLPWAHPFEVRKWWAETVRRAELPSDTVMYALRHSSIVRSLLANVPVRLVAALHDTSVVMIERHYAAYITDMSDEIARRSIVPFSEPRLQAAE